MRAVEMWSLSTPGADRAAPLCLPQVIIPKKEMPEPVTNVRSVEVA